MARILVVDDSKAVRTLIRRCLESSGMVIGEASGGGEGLKLLLTGSFDLMMMDLHMPTMDGLVMLRMKDAKHDTTPVILLTAADSDEVKLAMDHPCVMDYLEKPLDCAKLRAVVEQVLEIIADDPETDDERDS